MTAVLERGRRTAVAVRAELVLAHLGRVGCWTGKKGLPVYRKRRLTRSALHLLVSKGLVRHDGQRYQITGAGLAHLDGDDA